MPAALDWIERENLDFSQCWVSGFLWIINLYAIDYEKTRVTKFISVSPQPNVYGFTFLAPCPISGQIITGEKDELVSKYEWIVARLKSKGIDVKFNEIKNTNHFKK